VGVTVVLRLGLDASDLLAALPLPAKVPQLAPEIVDGLIDLCDSGDKFAVVDCYIGTAGAFEVTVRLKPSDCLRVLAAAARAGKVDDAVV